MDSNNKLFKLVGLVLLIIVISFFSVKIFAGSPSSLLSVDLKQKVVSSGVIKVGYVVYPPSLIKDPNTGQLSGIFYDALEHAGKALGLKIEWTEEVGWGTMIEGLQAGRYDMIGSPVWSSASRATKADFTTPLTYSVISAYARTDDNRFEVDYSAIDSDDVRISFTDGDLAGVIAAEQFPKAKTVTLPQTSTQAEMMLNVASGKADVTFVEPYVADAFLKSHPGSIKNVQPNNPLRINGNTMLVPQGQEAFKSMLNVALGEELNSGYIPQLLKKYNSVASFYPLAPAYSLPR